MRALALGLIGLLIGIGLGVFLAAAQGWDLAGRDHDHTDPSQHGIGGDHGLHDAMLEVPGPDAPSLRVEAVMDPTSGWNLHVMTDNFTFAPPSTANVPGEGHAHVYVDGRKLGRFYGPWIHVPAGEVRVTLNAHDHRVLSVDGAPVEAELSLD